MAAQPSSPSSSVVIKKLEATHLDEADRICRLAFGTFVRVPDPLHYFGDADWVHPRMRSAHSEGFGAWMEGRLAGSNIASRWGSVGFFGPLTVHPEFWERGVGSRLMQPVMDCFEQWGITHAGLFTFPHSPKHLGLYQKFGFLPRYLTPVMSKAVNARGLPPQARLYSQLGEQVRKSMLKDCREIPGAIYPGLDLTSEIGSVDQQKLGDTVLIEGSGAVEAFAICHTGAGTEGGSTACYVKFAAVRPSPQARANFGLLLDAVEGFASSRGVQLIKAGVNTSRVEAYQEMAAHGFRADFQGVTMHRAKDEGYHRPGVFVLDDWR